MWHHHPPRTADAALRNTVARLRRLIADRTPDSMELLTTPAGYRLVIDPDDIDIVRAQRLVKSAAGLVAEHRHEQAAAELAEAIDLLDGTPFHSFDPHHEKLTSVAVRALGDMGDPRRALWYAQRHRTAMADAGLLVSAELAALEHSILAGPTPPADLAALPSRSRRALEVMAIATAGQRIDADLADLLVDLARLEPHDITDAIAVGHLTQTAGVLALTDPSLTEMTASALLPHEERQLHEAAYQRLTNRAATQPGHEREHRLAIAWHALAARDRIGRDRVIDRLLDMARDSSAEGDHPLARNLATKVLTQRPRPSSAADAHAIAARASQMMGRRRRPGRLTFDQVVLAQSFWLARETGSPREIEAYAHGAEALAAERPQFSIWSAAAALRWLDLGDHERAGQLVRQIAPTIVVP